MCREIHGVDGLRDRTRPTNTIYRSTRALFNPNSHYAHAQDHHRTLLLFLQSYNPSHRPKSPILISILITLGTSNRVSAAARREQSHRRTGCSPRKRETGTHSDQSTHTIQSGATAVKSLLCNLYGARSSSVRARFCGASSPSSIPQHLRRRRRPLQAPAE